MDDSLSEEIAGARASKDNVQVVCRFRPPNRLEMEHGAEDVVEVVNHKNVHLDLTGLERQHAMQKAVFAFDRVFEPDVSQVSSALNWVNPPLRCSHLVACQAEVFEHTAKPLADEILKGFNCTVFAYGQTGSGKTHTMLGVPGTELSGIIPRLCGRVFDLIEEADENLEFTVQSYDLLLLYLCGGLSVKYCGRLCCLLICVCAIDQAQLCGDLHGTYPRLAG